MFLSGELNHYWSWVLFSSLEILTSSIELVASSFVTFMSRDFANITWSFAVSASRVISVVFASMRVVSLSRSDDTVVILVFSWSYFSSVSDLAAGFLCHIECRWNTGIRLPIRPLVPCIEPPYIERSNQLVQTQAGVSPFVGVS